jgi:predicted RNase H-like HicB family nuclease
LQQQFDVVIERDEDGYYVASVPQLPGCHTQARSLDEVTVRIREAIELCLEVEGAPETKLEFVRSNASPSQQAGRPCDRAPGVASFVHILIKALVRLS